MRSTALLRAIRRKYFNCHITWLTDRPGDQLLRDNPLIDEIVVNSFSGLLQLEGRQFDVVLNIDKSKLSSGLLKKIEFDLLYGFKVEARTGSIVPATDEAVELWQIGLSNHKKFFENEKTEIQLCHEALKLGEYKRDSYIIGLSDEERSLARERKKTWSRGKPILGINTGCAPTIPYKKLSISGYRELIQKINNELNVQIVLLGGPTEEDMNKTIAKGLRALQSPVNQGIRDGLCSIEACDIVFSGDSLGMHMAIALKKWVVAWFGPTCHQEIDLYDRGVKVLTEASCSPCWKRHCSKDPMCYDLVPFEKVISGIKSALHENNFQRMTLISRP